MASSGAHMMNQNPMGGMGTDFNKVFAAEKQNFEILNWKFALDDIEDAFVYKYTGKVHASPNEAVAS